MIERNLILQVYSKQDDLNPLKAKIFEKAIKTVSRYANNIGYDYILEDQLAFNGYHPVWEIFRILETNEYDHYDRIVYIDADVFAKNTNNDIFKDVKVFGACKEAPNALPRSRPEVKLWGDEYFNSGIVVFTRESINRLREINPKSFRRMYKDQIPGRDQYALNLMAMACFGGYEHIPRSSACYLREPFHVKEATLVHLPGRCRDIYLDNPAKYDKMFEVENA